MKRIIFCGIFCLVVTLIIYCYLFIRWKPLWELEAPRLVYPIQHHDDDTLRVIMIGDSWIEMHTNMQMDTLLQRQISKMTSRNIKLKSKGKGGKRSRGIYDLMFKKDQYGTKPLIVSGADYCVVSAGINDASANLGTHQFCYYMKLIISFLVSNGIRPIIIETPDVNIWKLFGERPCKSIVMDYFRSLMTGCSIYHYSEYREALHNMLISTQLMDSVIYVNMYGWNGEGTDMNVNLFLDDEIHLNQKGYALLDSCIASAIAADLR